MASWQRYLSALVLFIANVHWRRRLRSTSTADVVVLATRRRTIGDHPRVRRSQSSCLQLPAT